MPAPEVFRGHLDECLRHYSARTQEHVPKGSKRIGEVRKKMARFCGVNTRTVGRWFAGGLPTGFWAIKAMCFLDSLGYRVIELENMPQTRRHLTELIGYSMMAVKEATSALMFSQDQEVLDILFSERKMQTDRENKIWELFKTHKDALDAKKNSRIIRTQKASVNASQVREVVVPAAAPAPEPAKVSDAEDVRKSFVAMHLLLLLLEGGVTDALADPKRKFEAAERRTILQLSMVLNTLSSQILLRESTKEVGDGKS